MAEAVEHKTQADRRKERLELIEAMIVKADDCGFWLYNAIYNLWLTPAELSKGVREDKYIWSASSWELKSPKFALSMWEDSYNKLEKKITPLKLKLKEHEPKIKVDKKI